MTAERPWMKFYPQDWRADERLRNCGLAARGLWLELLAIMHRSERYGHLLINGKTPTDRALAMQVGATIDEAREALAELESEGVFSRDAEGTIFSRRMIRDDEKHRRASNFGKRGVRAKARKEKEESTPHESRREDSHEPSHKDTHQLRGQRPETRTNDKSLVARKTALPDGWDPEPFSDDAECRAIVDGWGHLKRERQISLFKAYHEQHGSRFKNWQAAWKTWVLNSVDFDQRRGGGRPSRDEPKSLEDSILSDPLYASAARKP